MVEFSEVYKIYLLCKVTFNDFWKTENKKMFMRVFLGFASMKPETMECIAQGRKDQKEIPSEIVEEKLKEVKTCEKNQVNLPILL